MSIYKKYLFEEGPFKKEDFILEGIDAASFPIEDWEVTPTLDLSTIQNNDPFQGVVGIDNVKIAEKYIGFTITNSSGTFNAKMWSKRGITFEEIADEFQQHKIYSVSGKWNEWNGNLSVIIDSYSPVYNTDPSDLVVKITESRTELRDELLYYISTLNPSVQNLALDILKDVWEHFTIRPAAKGHHHFQLAGLMQHTIELMRIAHTLLKSDKEEQESILEHIYRLSCRAAWMELKSQRIAGKKGFSAFYEPEEHLLKVFDSYLRCEDEVDRDTVLFSILVHDIGKLLEYTHIGDNASKYELWFPGMSLPFTESIGVSMDEFGVKLGHIPYGTMFVYKYLLTGKYTDIKPSFWLNVFGCILTHHGRLDWGSSRIPTSANEWLVHLADYVDSKYANEK